MKTIFTALFFLISVTSFSQQLDTIITDNDKVITGNVQVFEDRILVDDGNYDWMIMKGRIKSVNLRSVVYVNNTKTFNYINDVKALNIPNAPKYKDFRHHLKNAGAYGITSAALIIGGGLISAIGAFSNNRNVTFYGTAIGATGTAFLIPTFVFVLKAGKVKSYKIP